MRAKTSLRRLTSLLLCLVMLAQTVVVASAASPATDTPDPTPKTSFEYETANGEVEITDFIGDETEVVVPAAIDGAPVTKIGQSAFMSELDVTSIVIPGTVTYVDDYAFDYSYNLEDLYFYGSFPTNLDSATWDMSTDVLVHCKGQYLSDYQANLGEYFSVSGNISNSLQDPAYPAPASHTWVYTDNGDGTHSAACSDEGCTETIDNEKHTYVDGACACGAVPNGSQAHMFNYKVENGEATIIGYNADGEGGDITLPGTYTDETGTYPVTKVGVDAFNGNGNNRNTDAEALSRITRITVPASITTVEARGFYYVGRYASRTWQLREIVFEADDVTFGASALGGNPSLTTITLPANQTTISSSMFSKNTALTSFTVPASITEVGAKAFEDCTSLTTVTFEGAVPPTMCKSEGTGYYDGKYPFAGLSGLELRIPNAYKFAYNNDASWKAMLAADVSKKGSFTVVGYGDAGPEVTAIPDFKIYVNGTAADSANPQYLEYKVTRFDNDTHTGTVELKYVGWNSQSETLVIPETVTTNVAGSPWEFTVTGIGENAMFSYEMTGASSNYWFPAVQFPTTLEYIDKGGCWELERVTEIDLSNTKVHTIGTYAFYGCIKAETVKLPATLKQMGTETSTITIGDSKGEDNEELTYTENVFACCDALVNIFVDENNLNFKDVDGVLYTKDGTKLIRYPNAKPAKHFDIPEGVTTIASQAFMQSYRGGSVLETVSFPSTLQHIESLAFRQSSLTEVTLPAGVTFGTSVFDISKKLAKVTIPEGVAALSDYMFWSCEALTEVSFPDSLKVVGDSCFGHTGLTKVDLNQVEDLGDYAFYIDHLTEVTIPATATTIGTAVFAGNDELTKVTFADGAKTIGRFMFSSDYALTDLTMPDSIETIGEYAFAYCVGLSEVTMPASLKSMGDAVFFKCWKQLTKVVFPNGLGLIELPASTFESCEALTYLYLGDSIISTGAVSLYDTSKNLQVECAVQENSFTRGLFDVYMYDLSDTNLFSRYEKVGTDEDGNAIYRAWPAEGADFGSGGCGGTAGEGYYTFTAYTNPTFTFGNAVPDEPVVLTLHVKQPGQEAAVAKTYTMSDLKAMAVSTPEIGYQHWKDDQEKVIGSNLYVTLDALLADAELDAFGTCDSITATAKDDYTTTMTHKASVENQYYIDENGNETPVPAALLLSWNTKGTLDAALKTAYISGNLRFGYGINADGYGTAKGNRIAGNVVSLTVNVKAAHEDVKTPVTENVVAATCTGNGSHDEVNYCGACDMEISRVTVIDYATGHSEGAVVIENKVAATCTTAGTHEDVVYCTECKTEISRTTVTDSEATGHKWNDGVVTVQPTVSSEGVKTFTCTVCKATKTESVAKLPSTTENDQAAADAAIDAINKIGNVTEGSGDAIKAARKAYDSLTDTQKALVPHDVVVKMTTAEVVYASLLKRNDPKSTSTGSTGSDSTKKDDSKTVKSSDTYDAGIAVYVGLSLLSLTGGAWVARKNRKTR